MSIAHKIGAVISATLIVSVFLRSIRQTAEYEDMVKWDHVTAVFFTVLPGFGFASHLGLLYSIIPSVLLGWVLGIRWARMRIKRSGFTSAWLQVRSGPRIPIPMTIPPLPLLFDCVIITGCGVLGIILGLGTRAIFGHL